MTIKRVFVHLKLEHPTRYKKEIVFARQKAVRRIFSTVSFTIQDGRTPLHLAVDCGHTAVVTKLLESGADLDTKENLVKDIFTEINTNCYLGVRKVDFNLILNFLSFQQELSCIRTPLIQDCFAPLGMKSGEKKNILDLFY